MVVSGGSVQRDALVRLLEHEQYDESAASGACKTPHARELDIAYRRGHNDRARSLIALLSQGDVKAGLRELRDSLPVDPRGAFEGEAG